MKRFVVKSQSSCDSNDTYYVFDVKKRVYVGQTHDEKYAQFIADTLNKGLEKKTK